MDPRCPECQKQFERTDSGGRIVYHCPDCEKVWLPYSLLHALVREAVNAAGVNKKAIGLAEAPGQGPDVQCPACSFTVMRQIELRGVPVARCETCKGVLLQQGQFQTIVRRVVDAENGYAIAEADWDIFYQQVRLEILKARQQASGSPMPPFLF